MMKISYSVTLDDVIAVNEHHMFTSSAAKSLRWRVTFVLPLCILVILSILGLVARAWIFPIFGLVAAIISGIRAPYNLRRTVRKHTTKIYEEGQSKGTFGDHELEMTEEGITDKSATGTQMTIWDGIEKVETTPDFTFIFVSAASAHVIPRQRVTSGNYQEFVDAITEKTNKSEPAR